MAFTSTCGFATDTITVNLLDNDVQKLLNRWKFDEGTGDAAADSGPMDNDGTLVGSPTWQTNVPSSLASSTHSLDFNDDYQNELQYVEVANLDYTAPFTVSAWIKRSASTDTGTNQIIIGSKTANGWGLDIGSATYGIQDKLSFTYMEVSEVHTTASISVGSWHHIAAAYDGATLSFYLDGSLESSHSFTASFSSSNDVYGIGSRIGAGHDWFIGSIDDLRIFGTVLSAPQVANLAAGKPDLSVSSPTVTEGNTGTVNAAFTVTLSAAPTANVTVDYYTSDNTAEAGTDYTAATGSLTFTPTGSLTQTVNVTVSADLIDEINETFFLNLKNPSSNAVIGHGQGKGTITDDDMEAQGTVLVGLEGETTSGYVASFTNLGHDDSTYEATILWGDGQSSSGTITGGGGGFSISGSHTYERRGPYPVVVVIEDQTDDILTVAGTYAAILAQEDHARVQTVLSATLSKSGSLNATLTVDEDDYTITGTGSYSYILVTSVTDGLYTQIGSTLGGALNFGLTLTGEISTGDSALGNYTISELGTISVTRSSTTSDLEGSSSGTEIGTITITDVLKTGTGANGDYTLSTAFNTSVTITEDGVYGGLTYHRWGNLLYPTILGEVGDYTSFDYTATRSENYTTTTWNETGTIYGDPYDQVDTSSGNLSLTEVGNLDTADYTVTGGGSLSGNLTNTLTNAALTVTTTASGASVGTSINKVANWDSGAYHLTQITTHAGGTAAVNVTDQTLSTSRDTSSDALLSTTILQQGDSLTGAYNATITSSASGTTDGDFTNQTLLGDTETSSSGTSTVLQTGNVVSGNYDLTATSTGTGNATISTLLDDTATGDLATGGLATATIHRWGNSLAGNYTIQATISTTGSSTTSGANQGNSATGTLSLTTPTILTLTETGNTQSGLYTIHKVTTGSLTSTILGTAQTVAHGNATITSSGTSTLDASGNRIAGTYTSHEDTTISSYTGPWSSGIQDTSASGTITAVGHTILDHSGDLRAGTYSLTQTIYQDATITSVGTAPRGTFEGTSSTQTDAFRTRSGSSITGAYIADGTTTITTSAIKLGSDANTSYVEETNATATTITHDEANPVTGAYTSSNSITGTTILAEAGSYQSGTTLYTINTTITTTSYLEQVGNSIEGDYTTTLVADTTDITIHAIGENTNGDYDFTKTSSTENSWIETGDTITGDFLREGTYTHDSTATEVNTYTTGLANFTEILHEDYSFSNTGDSVTGDYTNTINDGFHSSSLEAFTTDGSGDYTVTQSMEGDFDRTTIGNAVSGEYLTTEEATDDYTVNQIGRDGPYFDLEMVGSNSYTDEEEGNGVTGAYIRTKNGTDIFTITITGVKNEDDYEQLVTGTELYTLQDTGNSGTGLYTREIDVDESSYTRTSTGAGHEMPSDSGSTDYHWEQTGDQHSGTFNLSQTGTDRYDLLEDFFDISNTQAGQTPGHMNVYPFGQTFIDPNDPPGAANGAHAGQQPIDPGPGRVYSFCRPAEVYGVPLSLLPHSVVVVVYNDGSFKTFSFSEHIWWENYSSDRFWYYTSGVNISTQSHPNLTGADIEASVRSLRRQQRTYEFMTYNCHHAADNLISQAYRISGTSPRPLLPNQSPGMSGRRP